MVGNIIHSVSLTEGYNELQESIHCALSALWPEIIPVVKIKVLIKKKKKNHTISSYLIKSTQ